jgi:hypothetical protein
MVKVLGTASRSGKIIVLSASILVGWLVGWLVMCVCVWWQYITGVKTDKPEVPA